MTIAQPSRLAEYLRLNEQVGQFAGDAPSGMRAALGDLVGLFQDLEIPYALFGAHAVAVYTEQRRSTLDIDLVTDEAALERIIARAPEHGFTVAPRPEGGRIVNLQHRTGVPVDIICAPTGFADLQRTEFFPIEGIGDIPVAAAFDVAHAKLRTQNPAWPRDPAKRAADRADLIALLRARPDLSEELAQDLRGGKASGASRTLRKELWSVCRDAEVSVPGLPPRRMVLFTLLAGALIAGAILVAALGGR